MQFQCESDEHNIPSDMKNNLICDCGQQCEDEPLCYVHTWRLRLCLHQRHCQV